MYHLVIDNYYKGRFRLSAFDNSWVFDGEFGDIAEGFGMWLCLLSWIKLELRENPPELIYSMIDDHWGG